MPVTFEQAALNWQNVIDGIPGMVKKQMVFAKRDMVTGVLDFLRDDPTGPRRRRSDDEGPLRIVSARLWESVRGNTTLRGYRNLPARTRKWAIVQGGRSEHMYRSPTVHVLKTKVKGTFSFGSRTVYARVHEKGYGSIPARPYFYPGVQKGFTTKSHPRMRREVKKYFARKLAI